MHQVKENTGSRIDVIDALRGFALLGITLRHFVTRFNYEGKVYAANTYINTLDRFLEKLDYHLLFGKAYPVFAFLFGFSFFLQYYSRYKNFKSYFIKRLSALLFFGFINAMFFPMGDILALYAIVGFLMMPLLKLPTKPLLIIAIILLVQPMEWLYISHLYYSDHIILLPESAKISKEVDSTIAQGNVLKTIWTNVTKGQLAGLLWAFENNRITQSLGVMILGFIAGREKILQTSLTKTNRLLVVIIISLLLSVVLYYLGNHSISEQANISYRLRVVFLNWLNLVMATFYTSFFILLYSTWFAKPLSLFKNYGRMSLTNYITQSVVGGLMFAPFGLMFSSKLSTSAIVFPLVILIFLQIVFSNYWLAKYQYGPIELLWRKLSR